MKTMEMNYLSDMWLEWCPSVDKRRGHMLPLSIFKEECKRRHNPGFRSVYMFDSKAAKEILDQGSSKGFKRYEPFSNKLFIDLDNGEQSVKAVLDKLEGISYKVFTSGSKGFHVEADTPLYTGFDLPKAHTEFVEGLGVEADTSLYRSSSLIAVDGRIHHKTGNRKTCVIKNKGELLMIPEPKDVPIVLNIDPAEFDLAWVLSKLSSIVANEPDQGWRHTTLWSIASNMYKSGLTYETTLDILLRINEQWKNPKQADEVKIAVNQAYQL